MKRILFLIALILIFLAQAAGALAGSYKIENVTSLPEGVADAIKNTLQAQGVRVVNEQGSAWCEVWLRKEIANTNKPASPDAKYPGLHIGSLLGVMKFPANGSDYRGQAIKPGIYTMRYCLILQDGNHMGAAPIPDFVLLIPASEDTKDPDATLSVEEVVNLSRKASGTNHPAVINLAPPPGSINTPLLEKDDSDRWVLKSKTELKPAADLPIGIVVFGRAEG
ncbi:MAG: hypothetical protein DMG05_10695 [Acidobacteria bacterium]|nr:MAG: hypothetical protein DMG05_10695 [Acidobacteriota bacterium]